MKTLLKSIIVEFQQRLLPEVKHRNISLPLDSPMVVTLIGSRRSGKTYLMYDTIRRLTDSGVSRERIVFLNFEDERLHLQANDLDLILQAYRELFPDQSLHDCYFFFDEIQIVPGWERFIRRIFDNYTRHIYVTGSNARLLSIEIADALRGRSLTYTVYPLSFGSYLRFINVKFDLIHPSNRAKVIHHARQFIMYGGFPESVGANEEISVRMMQSYFNTMIFRDIVERYRIADVEILKFFIKKLFAGIGKPLSVNRVYNDLRSLGYKISNNYLYDFEQYVYAVFLTVPVSRFDFSEIKQAKSEKKLYAIDTGLLRAVTFSMSDNLGSLFENTVLLEIVKAGYEVFYFKDRYECDFIIKTSNELKALQVSYQLESADTKNREIRGLLHACKKLNIQKGTIVTFDQTERLEQDGVKIEIIPFVDWVSGLKSS